MVQKKAVGVDIILTRQPSVDDFWSSALETHSITQGHFGAEQLLLQSTILYQCKAQSH